MTGNPKALHVPADVPGACFHDAWFAGSQVVDEAGGPLVLYHGGDDLLGEHRLSFSGRVLWASAGVELAREYAQLRQSRGGEGVVSVLLMRAMRVFDADALGKSSVRVADFFEALAQQSGVGSAELRADAQRLRECARREESGPHYSARDFFYETGMLFGPDGAAIISGAMDRLGFDAIRMTELGVLTFGARSPQVVRLVGGFQGAGDAGDLRDWQLGRAGPGAVWSGCRESLGLTAWKAVAQPLGHTRINTF
jgi:hypothetical protein